MPSTQVESAVVELNLRFFWPEPDAAGLASAVAEILTPEWQESFQGTIVRAGETGVTIRLSNFADWAGQLDSSTVGAEWTFSAPGGHGRWRAELQRHRLEIFGSYPTQMSPTTSAAVESLKKRLNLKPAEQRWDGSEFRGLFAVEPALALKTLEQVLQAFRQHGGEPEDSSGTLRRMETSHATERKGDWVSWLEAVRSEWPRIAECDCRFRGTASCHVRYVRARNEMEIVLGARFDGEDIAARFQEVVGLLKLEPLLDETRNNQQKELVGEKRNYFIEGEWTPERFEAVADDLRRSTQASTITGRYQIGHQEYSTSSFESWRQAVIQHWSAIRHIYGWFYHEDGKARLEIDTVRELLELEVGLPSGDACNALFSRLETSLNLRRYEGDPYQYRRFARAYRIKEWKDPRALASAVEEAIRIAYPRNRLLRSAYVTIGETAEDLEPFRDIEPFVARVASAVEFTTAHILVEGPRGTGLGITVERGKKKLLIRTSVDRNTLAAMERKIGEYLDITETKIEKDPTLRTDSDKTWTERYSALLVALVAGTFSILVALLGANGLPSLRSSLAVTAPVADEKRVAEVDSLQIPVRWTVVRKHLLLGEFAEDVSMTVSVQSVSGAQGCCEPIRNARPGVVVKVPEPGTYNLTVGPEGTVGIAPVTLLVRVRQPSVSTF